MAGDIEMSTMKMLFVMKNHHITFLFFFCDYIDPICPYSGEQAYILKPFLTFLLLTPSSHMMFIWALSDVLTIISLYF